MSSLNTVPTPVLGTHLFSYLEANDRRSLGFVNRHMHDSWLESEERNSRTLPVVERMAQLRDLLLSPRLQESQVQNVSEQEFWNLFNLMTFQRRGSLDLATRIDTFFKRYPKVKLPKKFEDWIVAQLKEIPQTNWRRISRRFKLKPLIVRAMPVHTLCINAYLDNPIGNIFRKSSLTLEEAQDLAEAIKDNKNIQQIRICGRVSKEVINAFAKSGKEVVSMRALSSQEKKALVVLALFIAVVLLGAIFGGISLAYGISMVYATTKFKLFVASTTLATLMISSELSLQIMNRRIVTVKKPKKNIAEEWISHLRAARARDASRVRNVSTLNLSERRMVTENTEQVD